MASVIRNFLVMVPKSKQSVGKGLERMRKENVLYVGCSASGAACVNGDEDRVELSGLGLESVLSTCARTFGRRILHGVQYK